MEPRLPQRTGKLVPACLQSRTGSCVGYNTCVRDSRERSNYCVQTRLPKPFGVCTPRVVGASVIGYRANHNSKFIAIMQAVICRLGRLPNFDRAKPVF